MPVLDIDRSDIPLWLGGSGSLRLEVDGNPAAVLGPGASAVVSARFAVDGNHDIALAAPGTVGIGLHAGAAARIVPIFQESQGGGADLVTRFALGDALKPDNLLLAFEVGGTGAVSAQGAFRHSVLAINSRLEAGVDATYVAVRAFPRGTTLQTMLLDLARWLALPGGLTAPPAPADLVSFEYGGVLKYSVGASAGYEIKGTQSFKISQIALSEHYALSIVGKLTISGEVAGRFSVDVTRGSQEGFARVVVKRRRSKELQIAADVNARASLTTDGLPSSGKEFLGALLGVQGKSWLNLADGLVTEAGEVDSIETLEAKLDGLAKDCLGAFAGKALDQLTATSEIRAFQERLARVVDSYRRLDDRAIALFDRYFDPVLNRVQELTARLLDLSSMDSWEQLKGEIDPALWNIIRQLTDGDPLGWALGVIPGTGLPSLPALKTRIDSALSLIADDAHRDLRDFMLLSKEQFGLDLFLNQLAAISSPAVLAQMANDRLGHFIERLIGDGLGRMDGSALKKAFAVVRQIVLRRDAFLVSFDRILEEAAAQRFILALHAAYNSASEHDALIDVEIKLREADGSVNPIGLRYMQAAGRGDFEEILANFQPHVVQLRKGLLSHTVSSGTSLRFNVAGWHRQFTYEAMHRVIIETEQQIRDSGTGLLTVFTTVDMTSSSERRKRGTKGEEAVLSSFLLRLLGESKVSDSSFDLETTQYAIDVITGMSVRYSVMFIDDDTSPSELDDYLRLAKELGLDAVGATKTALVPFLELTNGGFGATRSEYDVRYTRDALSQLMQLRPQKNDIKRVLRRIVLANYFGNRLLHDVGWLYGSDEVRVLFDDNPSEFVGAQSILGNALVRFKSPIAGLQVPRSFANTIEVRSDVAMLFRIEDRIVAAFQDLDGLLQSTTRIKTADLDDRLKAFGKALDAFDGFDNGENSIFAVFDGLIQMQMPAGKARASSLTFVSTKDGAPRTKVFTLAAAR